MTRFVAAALLISLLATGPQTAPVAPPAVTWVDAAEVLTVHDGDTVYVRLALDDETDRRVWLRLRGVFAPELSQPGGQAAKVKLAGLLPAGTRITVERFAVPSGKPWPVLRKTFDRYVADVWNGDGAEVNDAMNAETQ